MGTACLLGTVPEMHWEGDDNAVLDELLAWVPGCTGLHLDQWLCISQGREALAEAWPV